MASNLQNRHHQAGSGYRSRSRPVRGCACYVSVQLLSRGSIWGQAGVRCISLFLFLILSGMFPQPFRAAQAPPRKNILIINEVGDSHPAIAMINKGIMEGLVRDHNYSIEFFVESFDTGVFDSETSQRDIGEWYIHNYRNQKLDAIVTVGPSPLAFLTRVTEPPFPNVPVVFCGVPLGTFPPPKLAPRFTGTWPQLDAAKTIDLAQHLLPETRHVAIVAGTSRFDRYLLDQVRAGLKGYEAKLDLIYLTDLPMDDLLGKVKQLPEHTIILYASFLRDAEGRPFLNATTALPMVAEAANVPVFGMSDTYLGHGVVGGSVMSFTEQGRIAAGIVSEILQGKEPEEIPVSAAPSFYMFDWKELRRWHIEETRLPAGSAVYFREVTPWERTRWIWAVSLAIILGLAAFVVYLKRGRQQLQLARERQRELSGMLISAEENERSRLASELHDDFSQRLALLALGLENAAESIPQYPEQANRQLLALLTSVSEIGADLHTLSHRLHSSTLQSLGLVPGVSALCKEFATQQGIQVEFSPQNVPLTVAPDVALCLFRIVQEGLRNVKRHSGAAKARVVLRKASDKLYVTLSDEGVGFDLKQSRQGEGLGLRSMEERARLLRGRFEIHSELGRGTTVEACVPLHLATRVETARCELL
jgi:signal transduction histidine kinase